MRFLLSSFFTKNISREKMTRNVHVLICLFLVFATLTVYRQILYYEFIDLDDYEYVAENQTVQNGLTLKNIAWSFTTTLTGNWHPLTWMSHMLDCQIFGVNPGWHHFTNLIFHTANGLMLFFLLRKMTGNLWQSGFVAAVFALHPLQVESVAWIAERKNLLSTFFWMVTLWGYVAYIEKPNVIKYLSVFLFFSLGLMSKPMLVTLPFVMLLLDLWPLSRLQLESSGDSAIPKPGINIFYLVKEKLPFFALVTASSVVTFIVQKKGGAVGSLEMISMKGRIANALVSYVGYIGKIIWPNKLAILYPHPVDFPWWKTTGSFALLVAITVFVIRNVKLRPWLSVGWFWYLGTLVPVIGLVQVGVQAMADRYAYVPMIGLLIMIAWGVPSLLERQQRKKIGLALITAVILSLCMTTTWFQSMYWKNSIILFQHTLNVTRNNYLPHNNLAVALANRGRIDEAVEHYRESLRIKPDFADAHNNLGITLAREGRIDEAIKHYREALRKSPDFEEAHNNLAIALYYKGNTNEAIRHLREAIRIRPDYANAKQNLQEMLKDQQSKSE